MKLALVLSLALTLTPATQQKVIDHNIDGGFAAHGYDVVAYFSGKVVKGKSDLILRYKGARYKFSTKANYDKFKVNASAYAPQYGGWCAYAMADRGEKVDINPYTYEIRGGKLYLFYNAWGNNTFKSWKKEGPSKLVKKADANWAKIKYKKS